MYSSHLFAKIYNSYIGTAAKKLKTPELDFCTEIIIGMIIIYEKIIETIATIIIIIKIL
jgi:hypothetical protein